MESGLKQNFGGERIAMALIKCPECGGNLSVSAPVCIHCGMQIAEYRRLHEQEAIDLYNQSLDIHDKYIKENSWEGDEYGGGYRASSIDSPAVEYLEDAIKFGLGAAAWLLGTYYKEDGIYDQALYYFELADALGCYLKMGDAWYVEWGEIYSRCLQEINYRKAEELFNRALVNGVGEAAYRMAEMYDPLVQMKNTYNADIEKAKKYYRISAKLDSEIVYFDYEKKSIEALKRLYISTVIRGSKSQYEDSDEKNLVVREHELLEGRWDVDEIHLHVKEVCTYWYD